MRKLSREKEAELVAMLRLRVIFSNRALCRRFGISRRTLVRLQSVALDPFAEGLYRSLERQLAQTAPDTPPPSCSTSVSKAVKAEKV